MERQENPEKINQARQMIVDFVQSLKATDSSEKRARGLVEIVNYAFNNLGWEDVTMIQEEAIQALRNADMAFTLETMQKEA